MGRLLIFAAALTALTHSGGFTEAIAADEPVWHNDYAKAKVIAKRLNRPLFLGSKKRWPRRGQASHVSGRSTGSGLRPDWLP